MLLGMFETVLSAVCFGMLAVIAKLGYASGLSGPVMMQQRFSFGAIILLLALAVGKPSLLRPSRSLLAKTAFMGGIFYVAQSSLFVKALATLPAATASLIFYFYPVPLTLASALALKQKIDRCAYLALALVILGCGLVFHDAFVHDIPLEGLKYILAAMIVFSCYLLLMQRLLKNENPQRVSFWVVFFAAVSFNAINGPSALFELNARQLGLGLLLGLVPTALAVSFLYRAIERIGAAWVSIFSTFETVATVLAAHVFLGDPLLAVQFIGAGLIITGIALPNIRMLRLKNSMCAKHPGNGA